jgi:hypothetical protein
VASRTGRALRLGAAALLAPLASGFVAATCSPRDVERTRLSRRGALQLAWAEGHLGAPFDGYDVGDDLGVTAFDAILLSHLAMGLMNVAHLEPSRAAELSPLADEVAERVLSDAVRPSGVGEDLDLRGHHLYGSHALLVLGIEHHLRVAAGQAPSAEHDALATHLARQLWAASLAHPSHHAPSYPGSLRWPADQAVTLHALSVHDHEHETDLAAAPIAGWLGWLGEHQTDGLPWSAVSGVGYARVPRGCALSFMTLHMAHFAPAQGAAIYRRYRAPSPVGHGIEWLGLEGFREWPEGDERGSDVDAGPVILGWGTAATGIGLGAARIYGDHARATGIERIADAVGGGVPLSARYLLAPTLGQAMLFSGSTATPWSDEEVPAVDASSTGWPLLPAILAAVTLAAVAFLIRAPGLKR